MGDYSTYSEGHALSDGAEHDEPALPGDEDERGARADEDNERFDKLAICYPGGIECPPVVVRYREKK